MYAGAEHEQSMSRARAEPEQSRARAEHEQSTSTSKCTNDMCHASVCNARCRFTFVPSYLDVMDPSQSSRRRWRLCRRRHRWRRGRRFSNYTWRVRRRCRRLLAAFCRSDIDALLHARHHCCSQLGSFLLHLSFMSLANEVVHVLLWTVQPQFTK